jgi:D-xylose transport system substrate-binding protein
MVAELNGAPGDSNAMFLKSGYDFVLQTLYDSEEFIKGPDQFVDDWAAGPAREVFEQMLRQQPKINGVLAANDDIAGAVIAVLRKHQLNGKVPVTGEGATIGGLRNVLSGDQCLTFYKNTKSVVYTAASLASKLLKGETPKVGDEVSDPESGRTIPFSSLPPVTIEADQVKDLVADGTVKKADLCTGAYVALCARYGVK